MGLFKKKQVPDELPDLAIEEIKKAGKESKENEEVKDYLKEELEKEKIEEAKQESGLKTKKEEKERIEEGFFDKLQGDINKELTNLGKLEDWYNNKFLPQDIVSGMRSYWEKQKAPSIIKILGKNFKEEVAEKTSKLQQLEKEWQDVYFELIEKEEEIREQERELKSILAKFVELCKKRDKGKEKKSH